MLLALRPLAALPRDARRAAAAASSTRTSEVDAAPTSRGLVERVRRIGAFSLRLAESFETAWRNA